MHLNHATTTVLTTQIKCRISSFTKTIYKKKKLLTTTLKKTTGKMEILKMKLILKALCHQIKTIEDIAEENFEPYKSR
jgi:hypothetical protein